MKIALRARRAAADHQRLVAGILLLAGFVYLVPFVDRGWVPLDEGMVGQSAERVMKGQLPHVDYEEPYPGAMSYFYAAVFEIAGIDVVHLRWTVFGGAVAGLGVLYVILRRVQSPIAASVTTLVSLGWTYPNYVSSLPSWWILLCALVCLWSVVRHIETGHTIFIFVAGLSAGIAFTFKQTGLYLLPPLVMSLMLCSSGRDYAAAGARPGVVRAAISLAAIAFVLLITRSGLGAGEALYLVSPIAASCLAFLLWDRPGDGSRPINWRAPLIALGGAAVPVLILLLPHIAAGEVAAFLNGVFVVPQQRLQYTTLSMRPASQIVAAGAALLWICWSPPSLNAGEIRLVNALRWLVAVALAVISLRSRVVYALIWEGVRGTAALVPWIAAWLLVRKQIEDPHTRVMTFAASAIAAWLALSQFPFAAPIYFCYVAPLALIAGILCLNQAVPVRRLSDGPTIAVTLLFAVLSMNRGFVWNVGSFHEVEHLNAPLELSRAHLRVAADEASIFNRLVPLIGQHLGDRGLVAGPDTPDVYFLSGQFSPSGRLFDFFTDQAAMSDDARLAEWRRADVIVFFHGHRFSPPLPESLVSKLRQEFSRGETIPPFEVRWR